MARGSNAARGAEWLLNEKGRRGRRAGERIATRGNTAAMKSAIRLCLDHAERPE
jgi:hypothetical protein